MNTPFLFGTLLLLLGSSEAAWGQTHHRIPMSSIDTLTFIAGRQTNNRRVGAVPQLDCVGGDAKHDAQQHVHAVQCHKVGNSYSNSPNGIQWKCEAELPRGVRLGETTVSCEGYDHSQDPYVLKDSCGLQYSLYKTDDYYDDYRHNSYNDGYGYGRDRRSYGSSTSSGGWGTLATLLLLGGLGYTLCGGHLRGAGGSFLVGALALWLLGPLLWSLLVSSPFLLLVLLMFVLPTAGGFGGYRSFNPFGYSGGYGSGCGYPGGYGYGSYGPCGYGGGYGGGWSPFFGGMAAGGLASSLFGNGYGSSYGYGYGSRSHGRTYGSGRSGWAAGGGGSRGGSSTRVSSGFGGTRNR